MFLPSLTVCNYWAGVVYTFSQLAYSRYKHFVGNGNIIKLLFIAFIFKKNTFTTIFSTCC